VAGVWEYQTVLTTAEADQFVSVMHLHLVGETNDRPFGKRRYYRSLQA